nr:SRPBCC domain-containing protein [Mycobacterium sp. UM_NZ2]
MREICTDIDIAAPPERIWHVLTDFANYGQWNPFFVAVEGRPELGAKLALRTKYSRRLRPAVFEVTVRVVEEPLALMWGGGLGIRGIADGEHGFDLVGDDGVTHVRHYERLSGLIIPLAGRLIRRLERHYRELNDALKDRVECGAASR